MKGSERFEKVIEKYIDQHAIIFNIDLTNEKKNIKECIAYIFQEVRKSGANGFNDQEIYDMAIAYYTTDVYVVPTREEEGEVIVNHHVELTEEEKELAKQEALEAIKEAEQRKILAEQRKAAEKRKADEKAARMPVQQTLW